MTERYDRDLVGYGRNPPDPEWPEGARIALNFVFNVEEGSEPSMQDGEGYTETQLTEAFGRPALDGRDLAGESMFEYGSRVGFWRLLRLFQERALPLTMFTCALALERTPEIAEAIREDTALVSVMLANNETGVVFPLEEIAAICRAKGVLCHTDAVQTAGKLPLNVKAMGVDYLSLSAHKLHAPKGIGLLYARQGAPWQPHIVGGGQEHGRRGGTENVAQIIAFGKAAELAVESLQNDAPRIAALRDRMEQSIMDSIEGVTRNGTREPRLPNTSNLSFAHCEAEAILLLLDRAGICASSGSACTTGNLAPSHVLTAMGITPENALNSVRFSLSKYTTDAEVDHLLEQLPDIIATLRGASPKPETAAMEQVGG